MRELKLRVGGLELEYECEPEELLTIISSVLEVVGPRLLQNGGEERATRDLPQAIAVETVNFAGGSESWPLHVKLAR